jgi:tRNA (guanine-N7-)-methyltransferase
MQFHPEAKPEFVRHVEARRERLRAELPAILPPQPQPIVLEIGCGHGHFLTRYAAAHPDFHCVGIDILQDRLDRANKKRDRAKIGNLCFYKAEAVELLACLPEATRFAAVFLLFPDPWPKKRHHKNRLVRADFLETLAARMAPGGRFYFRTDHAEYFTAGHAVVAAHACWRLLPDAPWPFEEATVFQLKAPDYQSLVAEVRPADGTGSASA